MTEKKRYQIKSGCPQCGCSQMTTLSHDEMMAKYGHVANIELECHECLAKFEAEMENACPEWDLECKGKNLE